MPEIRTYAPPGQNHLLNQLPAVERERLLSELEPRVFALGEYLSRLDQPLDWIYFPTSMAGSVVVMMEGGEAVEAGTIGNDGFIGVPAVLGSCAGSSDVICQVPGEALEIKVTALRVLLDEFPVLNQLVRRYVLAYLMQVTQSAACNRLHPVASRCARWLLMTQDRVGGDTLPLTQEFLGIMLGVRRESVTTTALVLQAAGLIRYSRGNIPVLDRDGLEAAACECYRMTRDEYDRIMDGA